MTTPEIMRAVRATAHGGPEVLEPAEVAVPAPRPGEVLVRVGAVALNNTDLWSSTRRSTTVTGRTPTRWA